MYHWYWAFRKTLQINYNFKDREIERKNFYFNNQDQREPLNEKKKIIFQCRKNEEKKRDRWKSIYSHVLK